MRVYFRDGGGDSSDTLVFKMTLSINSPAEFKIQNYSKTDGMPPFYEIPYTFTLVGLCSSILGIYIASFSGVGILVLKSCGHSMFFFLQ